MPEQHHAENGRILESARALRARTREEAREVRDEFALVHWVRGETHAEISRALFKEFGNRYSGKIEAMVRRALRRRALDNVEDVEAARQRYEAELRALYETFMPTALGGAPDPDTGLPMRPDLRAAEFVLKVIQKGAEISGVLHQRPVATTNINVINTAPDGAEEVREIIQRQLNAEREKMGALEGTFSEDPVREIGPGAADTLPPPIAVPKERAR